jgi:hypothetical protein
MKKINYKLRLPNKDPDDEIQSSDGIGPTSENLIN